MDWEFYKRGEAGDAYAASQSRIIIEGDHTISPLEIFVREVLQNSLDAALADQKVGVHFRLRKISQPGARDAFLKALGWSKLKERVAAANRVRKNGMSRRNLAIRSNWSVASYLCSRYPNAAQSAWLA